MTVALGAGLAALFALLGVAKLIPIPAMRAAAEHLGYTTAQYRAIGALELAAAIGAIVGLAVHWIGFAAGAGVVVLMAGAAREHIKHRDPAIRLVAPIAVGAIAIAFVLSLN